MNRWIASGVISISFAVTPIPFVIAASAAPIQPAHQTAHDFVERIIAFENSAERDDPAFLGFFTSRLRQLILADRKAAGDHDAPYLDGDPFCDCQDSEGLVTKVISIAPQGGTADVLLRNHFAGAADMDRYVTLRLRMTKHEWRVDDIATREQPSLREGIQEALKSPD